MQCLKVFPWLQTLIPEFYGRAKAAGKETWISPTAVFKPPCECLECAEQYRSVEEQSTGARHLRYTGDTSNAQVATSSRRYCESLFADLQAIRSAPSRHEELIQKRWLKKSNAKRKHYLRGLRLGMYES